MRVRLGLWKIIICSFISFLSLQFSEFLQSEITQNYLQFKKWLSLLQLLIRKNKPHLSLLFKSNSFFSLALFSPGIHNEREHKLTNNYMWIKRFFKDVIYLFCCQRHCETFFRKLSILSKIWKRCMVGASVGGHIICVIMTHYVRKLICDSLQNIKVVRKGISC